MLWFVAAVAPKKAMLASAKPPTKRSSLAMEHPVLACQHAVGNKATLALLRSPVVQRLNTFYTGFPKSTVKKNPLTAIAESVESDTTVSAGTLKAYWKAKPDLKVAKTAKTNLLAGPLERVQRPDEAAAWLDTPNPNPGTRKDPSWITTYGNLGSIEDQIMGDTVQSYNGGHLIAWEFLNEAANIQGNIAPQAMLQNQALYRRIERTLEDRTHKGLGGVEAIVHTPYRKDPYSVTYQQLFDRGVISDPRIHQAIQHAGLQQKAITLDQMAPDTFDLYVLTQSGMAEIANADAREGREGIKSFPLIDFSGSTANKYISEAKPPALSILATNVSKETLQQEAFAFAHQVYLNYRTTAGAFQAEQPKPDSVTLGKKRQHALHVIKQNMQLAVLVIDYLKAEFDLSPTAAEGALIDALIESEAPDEEMDWQ